ncbi:hypothetical protein [Erysipelothrix anatis]|uniref:hypothetical protein n=1 Tax=Erysipelothrix anatis TaxID=2683713 RepID=UPI001357C517|nr:hypothetical protein [Erysipelothrix anatis]
MQEIILFIKSDPLWVALVSLPLVIITKNLLGAGHSLQLNDFNWNYLKRGLFKGILIYSAIGVLMLIAVLNDDLGANINGATVSVVKGLTVIIMGTVAVYVKDIFALFLLIFKQPTTIDENKVIKTESGTYEYQEDK